MHSLKTVRNRRLGLADPPTPNFVRLWTQGAFQS